MTSALQDEVRALARAREAVILAHNYQLPEVQDVADYVGDSLGLSRQAAQAAVRLGVNGTPTYLAGPILVAGALDAVGERACW